MLSPSIQRAIIKPLRFTDDNGDAYPEWEEKRLGEVANLYQPETISGKDLKAEGYPVYGANGKIGFYDKYNHESEQVAVTCRGNTCGTLNYTEPLSWITGNAMVVNPIPDYALKKFLYYRLSGINFDAIITGSGQPQITRVPLSKIALEVPSLPEQEKIAGFFSALDERIALTAEKARLLRDQKQGYLQKVFARELLFTDENGDTYPEWEEKKLGDVAVLKNGYSFESSSYEETGQYLVTTISNVTGNRYVDSTGSKKVVGVPSDIRPHQMLKRGDILISLTGNVGRVSVVNESNLLLNQRVGLIEVDSEYSLDRDFLYQVLSEDRFLNAMVGSGQGAAQKNIKKEDVENYAFRLPTLPEQNRIAEFFTALDEQIELTENKLTLLKEQKQGYLQGVFR